VGRFIPKPATLTETSLESAEKSEARRGLRLVVLCTYCVRLGIVSGYSCAAVEVEGR